MINKRTVKKAKVEEGLIFSGKGHDVTFLNV